jgi:hypothetical protein
MIFMVKKSSDSTYYKVLPITVNSDSAVFADSAVLTISGFNDTGNHPLAKSYSSGSSRQRGALSMKKASVAQSTPNYLFNIYRNGQLICSSYPSCSYIDGQIAANTSYKYEVYILDTAGQQVLFKFDSLRTGSLTPLLPVSLKLIPKEHFITPRFNKANGTLALRFGILNDEYVFAALYNALGRLEASLPKQAMEAGTYDVVLPLRSISPGFHLLVFKAGNYKNVKALPYIR